MNVAIVGAGGLIGRAVAAALRGRGDRVVAVTRRAGADLPADDRVVWDPATGPLPPDAFAGCDAVVNLAGAPIARRWTAEAWREIEDSRVALTRAVGDATAAAGVGCLITASAVGWYGPGEDPVDETAPSGSGPLADLCRRWEAAAEPAAAAGVRVVLLRTGVVLSSDGGALPRLLTPARLGLGGPLAGGRQWFPWIHIDDAVGLVCWSLDRPDVSGPLNLVAPEPVRQRDFAGVLGRVVGRPAVVPTPGFAMRMLFGEGAAVVTEGQHVLPAAALAGGYAFRRPELEDALRDLVTRTAG